MRVIKNSRFSIRQCSLLGTAGLPFTLYRRSDAFKRFTSYLIQSTIQTRTRDTPPWQMKSNPTLDVALIHTAAAAATGEGVACPESGRPSCPLNPSADERRYQSCPNLVPSIVDDDPILFWCTSISLQKVSMDSLSSIKRGIDYTRPQHCATAVW